MKIEHIAMYVDDLEGAKEFFESYFGAKVLKTFNNPAKNYYSYIMELNGPGWIELMNKPEMVDLGTDPNRLGLAHVCICADTREQLNTIIDRFKKDGYTIQYEPSKPDGPGEVRAVTFEDIVIEVNYGY